MVVGGRPPADDSTRRIRMNQQAAPQHPGRKTTEEDGVLCLLSRLGDELGAAPVRSNGRPQEWPPTSMQREEDEALLVGFREGLARLADARRKQPDEGEPAVRAALDGAQIVARNKLLAGEGDDLRRLLPAFAFLVLLPIAGEGEADRVAGRAARLVAEATPA